MGVPADLLERASKLVGEGKSIRSIAQEWSIPLATPPGYVKKIRDLTERGSSMSSSVG